MQRVRLSLVADDFAFTASRCAEFLVAGVDRVHPGGQVAEWTLSSSETLRGHVARRARPAHQHHSVGLHDATRPSRRLETQHPRRRDMLQVRDTDCLPLLSHGALYDAII